VKAFCAPCRSEGRPAFIGERPPLDDPRETVGVCWRHKLQTLKRAQEREADPRDSKIRFLVVVARHATDIFSEISEQFLDDPRVDVLLDRRHGERRKSREATQPNRRREDRRRIPGYWEDPRYHAVVIQPTWRTPDTRPSTPPSPPPIDEVKAMETVSPPTQAWQSVDAWVRETQHMLTRVIPVMVQESEELRRRAGSAEEQVARLKREMEDLQIEITRLGKEIDRLTTERVAMTDVVQRGMSGIVRLVDEVVATLKER
jgi:hypothetical protein